MKKIAVVFCLLIASMAAKAQFEQGTWVINPSISGMGFSYSNSEKARFGIGAQAGTFLIDGVALLIEASADWSKPIDAYTLGVGARYYFNSTGIYLGGGLDLDRYRWKGGNHDTNWGLGVEAGYAFFLSQTVTIEPAVYYKWRFNNSDMSKFGIKLGFGLYF